MLKRIEEYVDAALLSFPISLVVFFALIFVPIGTLKGGPAGRGFGTLQTVPIAVLIGGMVAVWVARILHRKAVGSASDRSGEVVTMWSAVGAVVLAVLLGIEMATVGSNWPFVWMALAVLLLALAVALLYDSIRDLVRDRVHKTIDGLRIVLLLPLGASVIMSLAQPGAPGSESDVGPWVLGVTIYMIVVALLAYGFDEYAAWRARTKGSSGQLAAGA